MRFVCYNVGGRGFDLLLQHQRIRRVASAPTDSEGWLVRNFMFGMGVMQGCGWDEVVIGDREFGWITKYLYKRPNPYCTKTRGRWRSSPTPLTMRACPLMIAGSLTTCCTQPWLYSTLVFLNRRCWRSSPTPLTLRGCRLMPGCVCSWSHSSCQERRRRSTGSSTVSGGCAVL